jgi:hypothetical protein
VEALNRGGIELHVVQQRAQLLDTLPPRQSGETSSFAISACVQRGPRGELTPAFSRAHHRALAASPARASAVLS